MNTGNDAQNSFIKNIMQEGMTVAIYLISGIRLTGKLVSYNPYALFLNNRNTLMIYKKAISTVTPIHEHLDSTLQNSPNRN